MRYDEEQIQYKLMQLIIARNKERIRALLLFVALPSGQSRTACALISKAQVDQPGDAALWLSACWPTTLRKGIL